MNLLLKLQPFLPVTVLAAVLLFFTKETLEFLRKRNEKKRTITAIKKLVAYQIEIIHWSYKSLSYCIDHLFEYFTNYENPSFEVFEGHDGEKRFKCKTDKSDTIGKSWPMPEARVENIENYLLQLAVLDNNLYQATINAIDSVKEINNVRSSIIEFCLVGSSSKCFICNKCFDISFAEWAKENMPEYFEILDSLYFLCTGNKLEKFKIR